MRSEVGAQLSILLRKLQQHGIVKELVHRHILARDLSAHTLKPICLALQGHLATAT